MKGLYTAKIYHKRFSPKVNEFCYPGFYIKFNIDDIDELKGSIFKVNRFGLFSFYLKDHGLRDGTSLREWALEQLRKAKIKDVDRIELQTLPRVLGYVFNPVSFWFCYRNDLLVAVISEVNNTFGQSHTYVVNKKKATLNKEFHVSPFYDVKGHYAFDFSKNNVAQINYFNEEEMTLKTMITGKEIEWSTKNFIKLFITRPLFTFVAVILIHYQAAKLFLKKIKFYKLPEKHIKDITYECKD